MAEVGRPKKTIDYDLVETLAGFMCTQEEIATALSKKEEISVRTLQRDEEFCRVFLKGQANAKRSLRSSQFKLAQTNANMAIWLGKQYLGQRDVLLDNANEQTAKALNNIVKAIEGASNEQKGQG